MVDQKAVLDNAFDEFISLQTPLARSNPISISAHVFGKAPRRQNSIEGFSKEIIDMFLSNGIGPHEPRVMVFYFNC